MTSRVWLILRGRPMMSTQSPGKCVASDKLEPESVILLNQQTSRTDHLSGLLPHHNKLAQATALHCAGEPGRVTNKQKNFRKFLSLLSSYIHFSQNLMTTKS